MGIGILTTMRATELPTAKVTARIINEDEKPLENLKIEAGFGLPYDGWSGGGSQVTGYSKDGRTNEHGLVEFEGKTTSGIGIHSQNKGYYESHASYSFKSFKDGKWQPWNPTVELVLRPILNPVKMYAKRIQDLILPEYEKNIGFDFEIGDFIAPYGKGKKSDILFYGYLDRRKNLDYDYWMEIRFPNQGDGIQRFSTETYKGSSFISPRYAPEDGYAPTYRIEESRTPGKMSQGNRGDEKNRFYFLRIRTVLDEVGKVKSANYVKIYGEFARFSYFFNPTSNDRNMEYGGNLLKGLKISEQPHGP